jgi:hypothetical protein
MTQSLSRDGQTAVTGSINMAGNQLTALGVANTAGQSVRFNQLQKGGDIAVIASSTVAIPSEGSLFNLTAAAAFNVTGFTGGYDGRTFGVRFNPDKLLTLVNSSTFKLLGATSRITRAGEIIWFTQESSGVIAEIGQQPILDLTGYSGSDISLGIGQMAVYDVSAITTQLLRIATGDNQEYEIKVRPTFLAGIASGVNSTLQPNNANTGAGAIVRGVIFGDGGTPTSAGPATNSFVLDAGFRVYRIDAGVCTRTNGKTLASWFRCGDGSVSKEGFETGIWSDTTTPWSSLGTLNFANAITGRIMVKRVM